MFRAEWQVGLVNDVLDLEVLEIDKNFQASKERVQYIRYAHWALHYV